MINIAICGASGRMGRTIYKSLIANKEFQILFGVDAYTPTDLPFPVYKSFADCALTCDVILDFSIPQTLEDILDYALANECKVVLSTTGHSPEQIEKIVAASKKIAIFRSSNMSLGVNLLASLSKEASKFLGDTYDVEIVETHHNAKLDAPSGTAIMLADAVREVRNNLTPVYGRHDKAKRRAASEIGIHSLRGGTVIGKHDVCFFGAGEAIKLSHESESKEIFVNGALRAAKFLMNKNQGLFDMNSIIGDFYAVTTISGDENITLISLDKTTQSDFTALLKHIANNNINLDMISQTINKDATISVSFTLSDFDNKKLFALLDSAKIDYSKTIGTAKLTIEGAGMEHKSGVALEVMNVLATISAKIFAITTSETKISCCINASALNTAEEALKEHYGI
ncbi:MAG TPA: 4-hydroxy-tetrahydrodipicolinate reductase [Clostridia bacterium]|nr:4-hydroxy-tetrahydrodipicolinate reductase [Clostridia bacterium]